MGRGSPLPFWSYKMSDTCEVVKVVRKDHPDGFTEINKSDLTDKDQLYTEKTVKPAKTKASK